MSTSTLYYLGVTIVIASAALTFPLLLFISAPYGRHRRDGWGPMIPARVAWVVQESPSVLLYAWVFFHGEYSLRVVPLMLFLVWQAHYFQRTFIFPFLMRMEGKRDPLVTASMAVVFNLINASINAYAISSSAELASPAWLLDPRFIVGVAIFFVGYVINRSSDRILRKLRAPGESGYKIPRGGLYTYVSCPNYLGELIEWLGWTIATWSLAGLAFTLFTAANLVPRARSHHRWYLEKLPGYPRERRIILPFLY